LHKRAPQRAPALKNRAQERSGAHEKFPTWCISVLACKLRRTFSETATHAAPPAKKLGPPSLDSFIANLSPASQSTPAAHTNACESL